MIIQEWEISVDGNGTGGVIPSPWRLVAMETHSANDKTYIAVCAFSDDTHTLHYDLTDFTKEELSPAYDPDQGSKSFVQTEIESLMDTKYGSSNYTRK